MTEGLRTISHELEDIPSDTDCEIVNQIKELKHNFYDDLTDKPEILKYIDRLHTIIRRQQKKLNKFYKKLKDHRFIKKHGTESKESQTDEGNEGFGATEISQKGSLEDTPENIEKNIADEVKEIAENAMKNTSFVYEPTSGMYYDYITGYYYNAELRMYYDGNTGQYLEYDEETKTYKYHSTVLNDIQQSDGHQKSRSSHRIRKKRENQKDRKAKKSRLDDAEEGEITESSVSDTETSDSDDGRDIGAQDPGLACEPCEPCEPCIRIMVEETNVDKLKVGSLFVVTCKGGTMGREGDHAVLIPDINVSKHHAKFMFDSKTSAYFITDLGSRNGTWLDGERLSAALQESENFEVNHGAIIQIGSTKLLCHVHLGHDTCDSCEPGLVQQVPEASIRDPNSKYLEYREQLQNLKKKFGVDDVPPEVHILQGYEDRAELRRINVGSSHPAEKTQTASVSEFIPPSNKGFKMLSKMGWTEGQKLGKNDSGLVEPVMVSMATAKCGLGGKLVEFPYVSESARKKQEILRKTQDRYKSIEENLSVTDKN